VAIKKLGLIYLGVLLIAASILYLFLSKEALLNIIIGFSTSALVVLASFKNYQDMVYKRLKVDNNIAELDNRDVIDKLEDPYNLYDEEEISKDLDLKETIKLEKELAKKNRRPLKEVAKDSAKAFSFIRILAYALFVFGFFYLLNNNILDLKYYLSVLIIPNIIAIIYLLWRK